MKMLGVNCDTKMKRNKGMYNSFSVNDIDTKKIFTYQGLLIG